MRLRCTIRQSARSAFALAAAACILLALATTAAAVPADNFVPPPQPSRAVATPTVVRETVVRPGTGTDAIVFVVIAGAAGVAILASGYLGARLATRGTRARTPRIRPS